MPPFHFLGSTCTSLFILWVFRRNFQRSQRDLGFPPVEGQQMMNFSEICRTCRFAVDSRVSGGQLYYSESWSISQTLKAVDVELSFHQARACGFSMGPLLLLAAPVLPSLLHHQPSQKFVNCINLSKEQNVGFANPPSCKFVFFFIKFCSLLFSALLFGVWFSAYFRTSRNTGLAHWFAVCLLG